MSETLTADREAGTPAEQASPFGDVDPGSARLTFRLGITAGRRLGLRPLGPASAAVTGLIAAAFSFAVPTLVTVALDRGSDAPWGRLALVAGLLGLADGIALAGHEETHTWAHDIDALSLRIREAADKNRLSAFTATWLRLRVSGTLAAALVALVLVTWWALSPSSLAALHPGVLTLVALLLYELAELSFVAVFFSGPFLSREARFDHDLFTLDPAGSLPVQVAVRSWSTSVLAVGMSVTVLAALATFLVAPEPTAVVPVVAAFCFIGYLVTFVSMAMMRRALNQIVRRVSEETTSRIQASIERLEARAEVLSTDERGRLHDLLELYTFVRDAPMRPKVSRTVGHAAVALVIPTLGFFLAVMSEVYAERLLDQLLP